MSSVAALLGGWGLPVPGMVMHWESIIGGTGSEFISNVGTLPC